MIGLKRLTIQENGGMFWQRGIKVIVIKQKGMQITVKSVKNGNQPIF